MVVKYIDIIGFTIIAQREKTLLLLDFKQNLLIEHLNTVIKEPDKIVCSQLPFFF